MYLPQNWNWIVAGDESRAFSSNAFLAANGTSMTDFPAAYVTQWPEDAVTRIGSEAELADVLIAAGLMPSPEALTPSLEQIRAALKAAGKTDDQITAFFSVAAAI